MSPQRRLSTCLGLGLAALLLAGCAYESHIPIAADNETATNDEAEYPASDARPPYDSGLKAHAGLRFDCTSDADCAIKDVGNCCGHYPACVHVDSHVDAEAVKQECAAKGLSGICGYPVIESCVCKTGRCEALSGPEGVVR